MPGDRRSASVRGDGSPSFVAPPGRRAQSRARQQSGDEPDVVGGERRPLLEHVVLVVDRLDGDTGSQAPQSMHSTGEM